MHMEDMILVSVDDHVVEPPHLFEGRLPDLNFGTNDGRACDPALLEAVLAPLKQAPGRPELAPPPRGAGWAQPGPGGAQRSEASKGFSHVVDGRFKGGYITRHYGRPADGVHAVQMEMCWRCYLDENAPATWDAGRAAPAEALLRELVQAMLDWRPGAS